MLSVLGHYSWALADNSITAPENGGYIFYGTTLNEFDRFYDIYNKGQDNLTEIEWSSVNKNGHVRDPLHFGHENWNCWDVNLMDVVCP